jgi:hypothetical protein
LDGWILGNEHLQLTLTSTLLSFTHPVTGQTTALTLQDEPDDGDSYTRCPSDQPTTAQTLSNWQWTLQSPLIYQGHGTIELNGETITLSLTIKAGSPIVEMEAQWVNTRPQHALSVWFETPQPITTVTAESHLGSVERTVDPSHPRVPPKPLAKNKEWVPNTGPIQRWVATNGLFITTQGLSEYETRGNAIGTTFLRCFGRISSGNLPTRTGPAGPPFETPDAQHRNQPCTAKWAIGFLPATATHKNDLTLWANTQAELYYGVSHAWSRDLLLTNPSPDNLIKKSTSSPFLEPMVSWENSNVARQCLKPHHSQAHAWVVRLLNLTADTQSIDLKASSGWTAYPTDGLEALPDKNTSPLTQISLSPHQLLSVLILRNPDA